MRDIAGKAWQENEKRCKRRFPIERELCYRILKNGRPAESGTGLTLDVSSGGIRFTCEQALPVDAKVEITMSWPATLENSCPLQLVGRGRMVRSEGASMACRIEKFEFRTKARAGSAVSLWASLFAMTNREQTPA